MNNKHLHYLMKDPAGEIWFVYDMLYKMIKTTCCTVLCYLYRLGNVEMGKNLRFNGLIKIYRSQCSRISIGNNCSFTSSSAYNYRGINHRCILQTGSSEAQIIIGNNCGFSGVSIVSDKLVKLGNNVRVGANASIADRDGHGAAIKPVLIDDNVWIGANVVVMKGVHIGENAIIGMNSVVTKDIPANTVAAGVPCKVIKSI